jgi:hypothetical protein
MFVTIFRRKKMTRMKNAAKRRNGKTTIQKKRLFGKKQLLMCGIMNHCSMFGVFSGEGG